VEVGFVFAYLTMREPYRAADVSVLSVCFLYRFYLKKPKGYKKGPVPIYVRIPVDGDEKEMSTKRSWELSRWDVKANRALGTKEGARALNDYLNVLQNKAYGVRQDMIERGQVITAIEIRDIISGAKQRNWQLLVLGGTKENPSGFIMAFARTFK
jgi:hypothetical protein